MPLNYNPIGERFRIGENRFKVGVKSEVTGMWIACETDPEGLIIPGIKPREFPDRTIELHTKPQKQVEITGKEKSS